MYPTYRKYKNSRSYFKIVSISEFYEIKLESNTWYIYHFDAKILPDRNYIYDMTFDYEKFWSKIEQNEYQHVLQKAVKPNQAF